MKKLLVFVFVNICLCNATLGQAKNIGKYKIPQIVNYYPTDGINYSRNLISNFYPIGWSKDGKFAYIEEPADEACGCYFFKIFIQDINTNKITWQWKFDGNESGKEDLKFIWKKHKTLFIKKLKESQIEQISFKALNKFPFVLNKIKYAVNANIEMFESEDYGSMVKQTQIYFNKNGKNKKLIATKKHTKLDKERKVLMGWTLEAKIVGFIKSPFENKIAIFYQTAQRGWEGPPNVIQYEMIGIRL